MKISIYSIVTRKIVQLFICGIWIFSASCTDSQVKSSQTKVSAIDSNQVLIDSAKGLLFRSNEYVKKGITGELSNKKVNKMIKPMMDQYELIFMRIKPSDTTALNDYRVGLINELIDLQIKHHP